MATRLDSYEVELLRLALDLAPSGMLAIDSSGKILLVNREVERLFGYSRDELRGQPVELLVPGRFRDAHPGFRTRYLVDPQARPMGTCRDLYGLRKDGTEIPIEIGLNPVSTDEGLLTLASVVDISARRRVEQQLRQSQKLEAIGTLAGGIAHDFNNILLAIIGYTELAQRAHALDAQHNADLEQVMQAAERGRQLIQRILTFSRGHSVEHMPIAPERIVRETMKLLRASLPTTVELHEVIDPNTPTLLSDETQMQQIVMNLVTNAAHAMPNGGALDVRLGPFHVSEAFAREHVGLKAGPHVLLSVIDTGVGMSDDVLSHAFEPFFTTKGPGRGSGLGLSVILGIVQSHGGTIELQSRDGQGTRVDVYLPAIRQEPRPETTPPDAHRILLVEDEPAIAAMLERQLRELGYRVSMHTSSLDALRTFQGSPLDFDLLVTDNTMPKLTGMALAQEILRARPELPVLLISGLAQIADPEELHRLGITKLLAKPHTRQELETAVKELLGPAGAP